VLDITTSGTASAPITYEAAPGATPVIDSTGCWNGVAIEASYVNFRGFTVVGDAADFTLSQALAGYSTGNPDLDGNGIYVRPGGATALPNHIVIENNTVYNELGGGIQTQGADYVSILTAATTVGAQAPPQHHPPHPRRMARLAAQGPPQDLCDRRLPQGQADLCGP
jgi:hypothetical protein